MKLLYLVHQTPFRNLSAILESGELLTYLEAGKRGVSTAGMTTATGNSATVNDDAYPGVYMSAIFDKFIGMEIPQFFPDVVNLVFCPDLLARGDYHYNLTDMNGFINLNTRFAGVQIKDEEVDIMNEVVFHHNVPLIPFLRQIWVSDSELMPLDIIRRMVNVFAPKMKLQIEKIVEVKTYPNVLIKCTEKITPQKPNYCFFPDVYRPQFRSLEFDKQLLRNCGVPESKLNLPLESVRQYIVDSFRN